MARKKQEGGIAVGQAIVGAAAAVVGAAVAAAPMIARALGGRGGSVSVPQNARARRLQRRLAKKAAKRAAHSGAAA